MSSLTEMSFVEYLQSEFGVTRSEKFLEKIDQVVPWELLEKKIKAQRYSVEWGVWRPRTLVARLIRILFLQGLYGLSDAEAEDQIRDRKSFQKFLSVSEAKDIPDETTICRFRNELVSHGIQESIFTITQSLLSELGYSVKQGHIQDGTILEAPKGRRSKKTGRNTRDKEASFTQKNGRTYHGYKWHIETSEQGGTILNTTFTTASIHDSQQADTLMTGDEGGEAYGDSAYGSKKRNAFLQEMDGNEIIPQFNERGVRGRPLSLLQKEHNRIKSQIRARVEHPFSVIKKKYGNYRVRYRGMRKNAMHWFLACALYNFEKIARKYLA